jgi:hypothetical protein
MSFSLDIAAFAKKAGGNADQVVRKVVIDLGSSIIMRTPVGNPALWKSKPPKGYSGGHARANWSHSVSSLDVKEIPGIDPSGSATIGKLISSVPVQAGGKVHFIQNSLPYIQVLEDGRTDHSGSLQAPNGMVGLAMVEFQSFVNQAVAGVNR